MNKVTIYGRFGKITPETVTINGEKIKKVKFSIADRADKNTTIWHNCVAWRGTADAIEKFCKVGDRINIYGQISSFKNQEGKEIQYITCSEIGLVETKEGKEPQAQEGAPF